MVAFINRCRVLVDANTTNCLVLIPKKICFIHPKANLKLSPVFHYLFAGSNHSYLSASTT
jgi:hypothetical protein